MRCHKAEKIILRTWDHPLSDSEQQALSQHLQRCAQVLCKLAFGIQLHDPHLSGLIPEIR